MSEITRIAPNRFEARAELIEMTSENLGWKVGDCSFYSKGLFCFDDPHGHHLELNTYDSRMDNTRRQYAGYFLVEMIDGAPRFVDEEGNTQINREDDLQVERLVMMGIDLTNHS